MKKRLTASFIALALVLAPTSTVFANSQYENNNKGDYTNYSVQQLTELIAKLTKQLEELKKATAPCFVSAKDLSLGDGEAGDGLSADVARLQSFLREKGYFQFPKNTGFFGKLTRTALLSFQNASGVTATGDFDAATREKAHALSCTKANTVVKSEPMKENPVAPKAESGKVTSITLTADGTSARWSVSGYSVNGFKIVWSKTSGPTYPTREKDKYNYLSDPTASNSALDAFDGAGVYFVRVCEYLGGACGVYSNEVQVQL